MTTFLIGALLLLALGAWMLRPAWRAAPAAALATDRPAAVRLLADELDALDRQPAHDAAERDAQQRTRAELQRRILAEGSGAGDAPLARGDARYTPWALALGVPLFAAALYAGLGNPQAIDASPSITASAPAEAEPEVSPEALDQMLAGLAQRLEKPSADPARDLEGWTLLARSYAGLQRFTEADRAYARASALAPDDAQLLADRADVLAVLQGQRTDGEPDRLIARALQLDPKQPKALALAGSAAFERRDYPLARRYWEQARAVAPVGSPFATGLDGSLAALARAEGDGAAPTPSTPVAPAATTTAAATPAAPPAAGAARLTGRVSLAPALAARVAPGDTVFVFARAAEGPRMPLAIVRRTVAELPFTFTLDDSQSMSPALRLSAFERVVVGARISRSGSAMPQPGDLRGESAAVATARAGELALVIDRVEP